jgi:hypothetical protein
MPLRTLRCRVGPGRRADHQIGGLSHIDARFGQSCDDTDRPCMSGGPTTTENQSNVFSHLPTIAARGHSCPSRYQDRASRPVSRRGLYWLKRPKEWPARQRILPLKFARAFFPNNIVPVRYTTLYSLQSICGEISRFQRIARCEARRLWNVGPGPGQSSPNLGISRHLATRDGEGQAIPFRMGGGTGLSWIDLGSAWSVSRRRHLRVDGASRTLGPS